ncbi:MAG: NAD(P)-binding protein [Anaerolineales bacterium]|nr:NAD(P)-binding protein [Anaerolineales bacterium]
MPENRQKTKVAVLGGGVGSMVAAFELTSSPELREKYEVTVYQMGWRLGGKGASGRNMERQGRIEEHGLHVWFGFYENAFNCIQRCYGELGRAPGTPLATWKDAFKPNGAFVLNEWYKDQWVDWAVEFPPNFSTPGDGTLFPTFWDIAAEFLGWIWEIFHDATYEKDPFVPSSGSTLPWWKRLLDAVFGTIGFKVTPKPSSTWEKPGWWDKLVEELEADVSQVRRYEELKLLALARHMAQAHSKTDGVNATEEHHSMFCEMLTEFKTWLWEAWVEPHMDHQALRELFVIFDTGTTMLCGIHEDGILENGFASVDGKELLQWLREHGAREYPTLTLPSNPVLKAMYDVAFAFEGGDTSKPNIAAGTALSGALRMVMTYKGAMYWKMQAGMGDTIFSPFYEVLGRRGVRFKFFHCVDQLVVSPAAQEISEIRVIPQVKLTVGEYDPLILVRDLPCWPSEPLWEQLQDGEQLKARGINFEEDYNPLDTAPVTLKKGQDFDLVVLGISLGALPYICRDLIKQNVAWKNMTEYVRTVRTQAFQVWVDKTLHEGLGWEFNPQAIMGSYVEPLDTVCNMDQLLDKENWPANYGLGNITYVCGVMKEIPGETFEQAMARVKTNGMNFMNDHTGHMWPRVVRPGGRGKPEFEWNVLIDPQDRSGEARFDAQFWRANYVPSERYVQSVAGSTQYRLRADGSGYANLYLTGDWLLNGFNVGHVESAVASGMQASRAICGLPKDIPGEKDPWL